MNAGTGASPRCCGYCGCRRTATRPAGSTGTPVGGRTRRVGIGWRAAGAGVASRHEGRFGQDFGDVRIHNDDAAHHSAKSVNAQAYTVGPAPSFNATSTTRPLTPVSSMLAHGVTHDGRTTKGPVDGTDAGGGVKVSDPSDRFERDAVANADRVPPRAAPSGRRMPPAELPPGQPRPEPARTSPGRHSLPRRARSGRTGR